MKKILTLLVISITVSCNSNKETDSIAKVDSSFKSDSSIKNNIQDTVIHKETENNRTATDPYWDSAVVHQFNTYKVYSIKDSIRSDFNGDGFQDIAYFKNTGKEKKIFISDGQTKKQELVGTDASFNEMGSDFNWVDFWGTLDDKETFEIIVKDGDIMGERKTKLKHTSLFVRKEESGGGVIIFLNKNYKWVHQSD